MEFYLAQVNIAKMLAPLESPDMKEFVANLGKINSLADGSDGFVWRLKEDGDDATAIRIFGDGFLLVNLSVWKDPDTLYRYIYKTAHAEMMKRRKEWFEKMHERHTALWYVSKGELPTVTDAEERLVHIRNNGETPYAFSFKKRFTLDEANRFEPIPGGSRLQLD